LLHFTKQNTEDALWLLYWHGRSQSAFNRLADFYLPWVKSLAIRKAQTVPVNVDWQDLYQDGSIALLDCIQRYEDGRDVKFKTFATRRIIGAFADGLRNMDWVPRKVRERKEEVVSMTQPQVKNYKDGGDSFEVDCGGISDRKLANLEMRDELRHALRGLHKKVRLAMILYFLEEMTMRQVAESLGVSESYVSMMITDGISFLRTREGVHVNDNGNRGNHRRNKLVL